MRILDIAVFIAIFSAIVGALTGLGYGEVSVSEVSTPELPNETQTVPTETSFIHLLLTGWSALRSALTAAFLTGTYLKSIVPWIPDSLANALTVAVNLIYVLGVVQWLTGRSAKVYK